MKQKTKTIILLSTLKLYIVLNVKTNKLNIKRNNGIIKGKKKDSFVKCEDR